VGIELPQNLLVEYVESGSGQNLTAGLFMRLGSAFSNIVLIVSHGRVPACSKPRASGQGSAPSSEIPIRSFPSSPTFSQRHETVYGHQDPEQSVTGILIRCCFYVLRVDFPVLWGFWRFFSLRANLGAIGPPFPGASAAFSSAGRAVLVPWAPWSSISCSPTGSKRG